MKSIVIFVLTCGLAACSSNPSTKNANSFYESLTKIADYPFQMQSLQLALHFETTVDRVACRYLRGGSGAIPVVPKFEPDVHVKNRLNLLASMLDYADALQNVSELKSIGELRTAASNLNKSFTTVFTQLTSLGGFVPSGASAIPIGGITNLILTGIVDLRELDSRRIIRQTARDMHGTVALGFAALLSGVSSSEEGIGLSKENDDDYQTVIEKQTNLMLADWKLARECVIQTMHRNGSNAEAYKLFVETSTTYNSRREKILLNKTLETDTELYKALGSLAKMHESLARDDVDFEESLSKFADYASKVKVLLKSK